MTWGPLFMYYNCPHCGMKFKYDLDMLGELGDRFGSCPGCGTMGVYEKEGPRMDDDNLYFEAE